MKQIKRDLWETSVESPFPGLYTHAYLLKCKRSNILIYNTSNENDLDIILETGGIETQYLSHRDELGPSIRRIKDKFSSDLVCHELERKHVEKYCNVDVLIKENTSHVNGLDILHTPGHTNGSISFVFDSPIEKQRYLFVGDTVYLSEKGWNSLIFPGNGGNIDSLINTLENYILLKPDVIVSSGSSQPITCTEVSYYEWKAEITKLISRLKEA
tara:strand:- start:2524 stop:3165 length:642 start_codon:yes stop_codon:yes gene_type:complete